MFAQIKATSCRHHKKRGGGGGWAGVWGVGVRDVVAQKQLCRLPASETASSEICQRCAGWYFSTVLALSSLCLLRCRQAVTIIDTIKKWWRWCCGVCVCVCVWGGSGGWGRGP